MADGSKIASRTKKKDRESSKVPVKEKSIREVDALNGVSRRAGRNDRKGDSRITLLFNPPSRNGNK